jgi:hypothetical protein
MVMLIQPTTPTPEEECSMSPHRPVHLAALGLALAAVAVPTASARPDGPLGQQAVQTSSLAGTTTPVDLRSPDARDAATAAPREVVRPAPAGFDRRTPDARDAADAATGRVIAPRARLAAPASADQPGGTDWGDVALAAAAITALLLALAGAGLAVQRRVAVGR